MSKWILLVALALGGFLVWKYVPLTQQSGSAGGSFQEYIPSDTIFYSGGYYDAELIDLTSTFYSIPFAPTQAAQLEGVFSSLQDGDESVTKFFNSLYAQFQEQGGLTLRQKMEVAGIATDGEYAMYAHGAVPVVRMSITDKAKIIAILDKAVADSGLTYTQQTIGSADVRLWPLTSADEPLQVTFAFALEDTNFTATLFIGDDDDAIQKARLGQTPLADSLAASGAVEKLKTRYGFNELGGGFISIINIVKGLFDQNVNSFGKDLARYLPEEAKAKLLSEVIPECRKDFTQLFASMPRLVSGYSELGAKGDTLVAKGRFVWELESAPVKAELGKMRGHVPLHATASANSLMSFGTGLNIDTLVPALTTLWRQFTQAPFTCDILIAAQAKAKEQNPAMLQMFLGMAQGVKGLGMSIFDIKMGEGMQPEELSVLISVATESPESLAAMTSMIPLPELNGLLIPTDGTPVDLALPMMPETIQPKAAIKGKFLVVYAGTEAETVAKALSTEPLTPNGLYGFGFNYRKLGDIFGLISQSMGAAMSQGTSCIDQQETLHIMSSMPMDFSMLMDFNDNGMDVAFAGSVDKPVANTLNPVGSYSLEYLNDDCQWEPAGSEKFKTDGTGEVSESDRQGACVTFENTYSWAFNGSKINISNIKGRYRDDCDSEWQSSEDEPYSCYVMNANKGSFQCLFDAGSEDASLYRYTRTGP